MNKLILIILILFSFGISAEKDVVFSLSAPIQIYNAKENHINSDFVRAIAENNKTLYIGTDNGISILNIQKGICNSLLPKKINQKINALYIKNNILWIAMDNGIISYNISSKEIVKYSSIKTGINNSVSCISTRDNEMWFGTNGEGVFVFNTSINTWKNIAIDDGLSTLNINSIYAEQDTVLIGTDGSGLNILDVSSYKISKYDRYDGLSNNTINTIYKNRGQIYLGTNNGFSLFNLKQGSFINFHRKNGLKDELILSSVLDGNTLWLGTVGGVSAFDITTQKFVDYGLSKNIPDDFVSSLAVCGEMLLVGFDGSGLAQVKKPFPEISITNTIIRNGKMEIYGSAFSFENTSRYKVKFFNPDISNARFTMGMNLKAKNVRNGLLAVWDLENIVDGEYIIELAARINRHTSTYQFDVKTDVEEADLNLDPLPGWSSKKKLSLTGSYSLVEADKIVLYPGAVEANYDNKRKKFFGVVNLNPGRNRIRVVMYSQDGGSTERIRTIHYKKSLTEIKLSNFPQITALDKIKVRGFIIGNSIRDIVTYPSNVYVRISDSKKDFELSIPLNHEGENLFIINIFDTLGNKTSKKLSVYKDSKGPELFFSKLPRVVSTNKTIIYGRVGETGISTLVFTPPKQVVIVDSVSGKFKIKVNLMEGKNDFYLLVDDKFGNNTSYDIPIIYDKSSPIIDVKDILGDITVPMYTIRGKFEDLAIKSILVEPGSVEANINFEDKTFSIPLLIKNGKNEFTLIAIDKAGNRTKRPIVLMGKLGERTKAIANMRIKIRDLENTIKKLKIKCKNKKSNNIYKLKKGD